jgi:hypothetical protein
MQDTPTIIYGDNEGSVILTHNPQFHQRSKHITLCYHWICDFVTNGILKMENCQDPENTADILTKALPKPKHIWH